MNLRGRIDRLVRYLSAKPTDPGEDPRRAARLAAEIKHRLPTVLDKLRLAETHGTEPARAEQLRREADGMIGEMVESLSDEELEQIVRVKIGPGGELRGDVLRELAGVATDAEADEGLPPAPAAAGGGPPAGE